MQRTGRLIQLLQMLRERRTAVTAQTLVDLFDVSERTIYRDIETLVDLGVPVEGESGVGFILRPGYFFAPMALTHVEADAIQLGLRFVAKRGDDEIAAAAQSALIKIAEGMGEDAAEAMRSNGLTVGPSGSGKLAELATIRVAMREQKKLRIVYKPSEDEAGNPLAFTITPDSFCLNEVINSAANTGNGR